MMRPAEGLRACLDAAIASALPSETLAPHLPPLVRGRNLVVGAGKASAAMAKALEEAYGPEAPIEGLVVTRDGHGVPCDKIEIIEAAHPVPDARGAAAAARLLALAGSLGEGDQMIALISGGGSALLTCPPEGIPAGDIQALNSALLASGAPIDAMNCIRRHLSRIAGGRLAAAAFPAKTTALLISDVPGDAPLDIASGPTAPDPTTLADARAAASRHAIPLSPIIESALKAPANESPKPGDPRLARCTNILTATPRLALEAAARCAATLGWEVEIGRNDLEGEARTLGAAFAADALARQAARPVGAAPLLLLTGGETTVTLPPKGRPRGAGGRNVDFLLGLLQALSGAKGIYALAADTDGIDGIYPAAGGLITPESFAAAAPHLEHALATYDGHGLMEAIGGSIKTGPTLTNVNDFRAILITQH